MMLKVVFVSVAMALICAGVSTQFSISGNNRIDVSARVPKDGTSFENNPDKRFPVLGERVENPRQTQEGSNKHLAVFIESPIQTVKCLHMLQNNISWALFKEIYERHLEDPEAIYQQVKKLKSDLGFDFQLTLSPAY